MNLAPLLILFFTPTGPLVFTGVRLTDEVLTPGATAAVAGLAHSSFAASPQAAGTTVIYTARFVDADGDAVPASAFSSLTLSLIDLRTGLAVNAIAAVNVLDTGRGTLDESGIFGITLSPADTILTGTKTKLERRAMVFEYIYNGDTGRHAVQLVLERLP